MTPLSVISVQQPNQEILFAYEKANIPPAFKNAIPLSKLPEQPSNDDLLIHYSEVNIPSMLGQAVSEARGLISKVTNVVKALFKTINGHLLKSPLERIAATISVISTDIEKIFNVAACIPLLAILSGSLRTLIGTIQSIAGAACIAIGEFGQALAADKESQQAWHFVTKLGLEHVLHGALNTIRGYSEAWIGTSTMGAGSLLLIVPNTYGGKNFAPYRLYAKLIKS